MISFSSAECGSKANALKTFSYPNKLETIMQVYFYLCKLFPLVQFNVTFCSAYQLDAVLFLRFKTLGLSNNT